MAILSRPDIANALARLSETETDLDLTAAIAFARRKRLGPYRTGSRPPNRNRELAAMARAGFGRRVASRIIDAASIASLEERDSQ